MNKRSLILLLLLVSPLLANDKLAEIKKVVKLYYDNHQFDGTVLVAEGDKIIYKGAFGEADRDWNIPHTPDSVFLLASISKQFTAAVILQLVEQGKIDLQAPISRYLPDYPKETGDKITIHHLLTHTSGLPHYRGFREIGVDIGEYGRLDKTIEEYAEVIGRLKLRWEPGSRHAYSSMGYILLGLIAEKVTGQPFNHLLQEGICKPLGMKNTGFANSQTIVERLSKGYVHGVLKQDDGTTTIGYRKEGYRDQLNKYTTGGLHSDINDMFLWMRSLFSDKVLQKESRDMMLTPQAESYGYGINIRSGDTLGLDPELVMIGHSGGLEGFSTYAATINKGEYTVIALGNSGNSRSGTLVRNIFRILYGKKLDRAPSSTSALLETIINKGPEAAHKQFAAMDGLNHSKNELNGVAYELMGAGSYEDAKAIIEIAIKVDPSDANLYDSLAEAHMRNGEKDAAIKGYHKAIEIAKKAPEPQTATIENATRMLKQLGVSL